jgi:hypothetical protein
MTEKPFTTGKPGSERSSDGLCNQPDYTISNDSRCDISYFRVARNPATDLLQILSLLTNGISEHSVAPFTSRLRFESELSKELQVQTPCATPDPAVSARTERFC